ncbi:ABC transporter permease [Pseudomonas monteilii]|uniref:ABC transporter permease n=1 Tax=Pseudomonas monteilii TaxID=76759 RepID=UPI001929CB4F|nr:ABC transporter permease subunit [Pseudomonas monteilii]
MTSVQKDAGQPGVNVQTLLNEHPFSGFQWVIFALCFLIVLLDGFDTAAIGYIAPSLISEWGVSKPALAPVLSAALFGLAALAATVLPLLSIALTAFTGTLSGGVQADNFTLRHFAAIFERGSDAWSALTTSFSLAAGVALLTGALGALVAYCVLRFRSRWSLVLDAVSVLPNAMPGIVVAVGLILAWNQPWLPITPYNTWAMLLMAYACLLLPYPVRYANAALQQVSVNLESSARVHGAGPWRMLARIVLPLLAPAVGAAMLLVFSIASRELVASLLLAPTGMQTVSVYVWRQFEQGSVGEGMAMSLVAIAVAALLVLLAHALQQLRKKA